MARKLARMVYFMLTRGEEFVDQGQQHYEEQQRQRSVAAFKRRATNLGFVITPVVTGPENPVQEFCFLRECSYRISATDSEGVWAIRAEMTRQASSKGAT